MIPDIKIEVEEKRGYWWRMLWVPTIITLFFTFAFIYSYYFHKIPTGNGFYLKYFSIIPAFILLITYVNDKNVAKFVTQFEVKKGDVRIEYSRRNKPKVVEGNIRDFFVGYYKGTGRSQPYIQIEQIKMEIELTISKEWNWKGKFDELVDYLEKNDLINT